MKRMLTIAAVALAALPATAQAAPGQLDRSFGGGGIATPDLGTSTLPAAARAVAVQPDGKIVVAAERGTGAQSTPHGRTLARLDPDGSLDAGFGTGGLVYDEASLESRGWDVVALQPDGRIVVAGGYVGDDAGFVVARFLPNGEPDPEFGTGGRVVARPAAAQDEVYARAVLVEPDGQIVVAGDTFKSPGHRRAAFVRLDPDGDLDVLRFEGTKLVDLGFSTDGALVHDFCNGNHCRIVGLALQPDGRIAFAGDYGGGGWYAGRLNAVGGLDSSFAGDGAAGVNVPGGTETGAAVAVQPGGRIVTGGSAAVSGGGVDFALAGLAPADGSLDAGFGGDGFTLQGFAGEDRLTAIAVQADGKVVTAGWANDGAQHDFALARFGPDGALDPSFGDEGTTVTDGGTTLDQAAAVAIAPDGDVIVAGAVGAPFQRDVAVARYDGDSAPAPAPDGGGGDEPAPAGEPGSTPGRTGEPGAAPDTRAPSVRVRIRRVTRRHATVTVGLDEPGAVRLTARGRLLRARAVTFTAPGRRTVRLRLTRAGRRVLRRRGRVLLRATGVDVAGNRARVTVRRRLSRG